MCQTHGGPNPNGSTEQGHRELAVGRTHASSRVHAHDRKRRAEPDPDEAGSLAETKLVVYAHDPLDSLLADVGPCAAATERTTIRGSISSIQPCPARRAPHTAQL